MKDRVVKRRRTWIPILALALTALLLFTACAPRPPVKQVVRIGMIAALTGPPAAPVQMAWRNIIDYLRYFEETDIPGVTLPPEVTIELLWGDSGYAIPRAISIYERLSEQDVVFFYLPSPAEGEGLKSRVERDVVPAFVMCVSEDLMYPAGWVFSIYPTESERFAVLCDWIMENWQEERPPRVAIMGPDVAAGRAPEVMGTKYAESMGIEMLPMEFVPAVPLDTTSQLFRLEESGADYVYVTPVWTVALPILRDAERLGLTDKIRFGGVENSQSISLIETLGPAAEGYFAARATPWYKEVPVLGDIFRVYRGKIDTEGDGAGTLLFVPAMIKAINTAIQNVGYENLDGRAVKEAMYSIKDFDPHGIGRTVTYTHEDHRGAPAVKIYQVWGGEVVSVSDWRDAPMLVPEV